jgi:hypothetical protein
MTLTVHKSLIAVSRDLERWRSLAEKRNYGLPGMATNDGNLGLGRVLLGREFLSKGLCANDIKGRNSEKTLRIENTGRFEHLRSDWNSRVDWVRDDEDKGLGGEFSDALSQVSHDSSVNLEEVIAAHARFTRNASGNDHHIGSSQSVLQTVVFGQIARNFLVYVSVLCKSFQRYERQKRFAAYRYR